MSTRNATLTRLDLASDMAREMVRLDRLIKRAARERQWTEAAALEETRDDLVHARMAVLRRDWQGRRVVR